MGLVLGKRISIAINWNNSELKSGVYNKVTTPLKTVQRCIPGLHDTEYEDRLKQLTVGAYRAFITAGEKPIW